MTDSTLSMYVNCSQCQLRPCLRYKKLCGSCKLSNTSKNSGVKMGKDRQGNKCEMLLLKSEPKYQALRDILTKGCLTPNPLQAAQRRALQRQVKEIRDVRVVATFNLHQTAPYIDFQKWLISEGVARNAFLNERQLFCSANLSCSCDLFARNPPSPCKDTNCEACCIVKGTPFHRAKGVNGSQGKGMYFVFDPSESEYKLLESVSNGTEEYELQLREHILAFCRVVCGETTWSQNADENRATSMLEGVQKAPERVRNYEKVPLSHVTDSRETGVSELFSPTEGIMSVLQGAGASVLPTYIVTFKTVVAVPKQQA